jgi:hypothetical protein
MPLFGMDISHHQDLALDFARCKREGVSFVILKSTEGASFVDGEFQSNLGEARGAGLLVAAYHYVKSNASAAAQVAHIAMHVPKSVPVIPDTEDGGGPLSLTRDVVTKLRAAGYRVPLLYLPKWYWQQIGSPSMAGLPPLWSSRYPNNVIGPLKDKYAQVPASYWTGYGGLDVAVLQFTSSARIAGFAPLDANAFRGTPAQLAALFGGTPPIGEDDELNDKQNALLEELHRALVSGGDMPGLEKKLGGPAQYRRDLSTVRGDIGGIAEQLTAQQAKVLAAIAAVDDVTGQVDVAGLANALLQTLPDGIADVLGRKLITKEN